MKFSARTSFPLAPNRLSARLAELTLAGRPLVDLTLSNPTRAGLAYAPDLLAPLGHPRGLVYEPAAFGLASAREAVARASGVPASQVLLTASTSEAYALLFKLLADPGDDVLAPRPTYPLFDYLAALEGVRLGAYDLAWDGAWHVDLASVEAALTPRTRAVLVVSPHNPTGAWLKRRELDALAGLCAARGLALIVDEVFAEYPLFEPREPRVATVAGEARCLTFVLGGLSKARALPQVKLAWTVASGPPEALLPALDRLDLVADTYLSPSTPAMAALPELVARTEVRDAIRARCVQNVQTLQSVRSAAAPWDVLAPEAGWSAVLRVPAARSEEAWALALLDAGVVVHPGFFFDFPRGAHLVVSLLPEPAVFAEGARRLARVLSREPLRTAQR